jgi:hypothetical protein
MIGGTEPVCDWLRSLEFRKSRQTPQADLELAIRRRKEVEG